MIKDLLYTVKLKIEEGSIASIKDKIGSQGAYIIPVYKDLIQYKQLLEEEIFNQARGFKPCLKDKELECLKDHILSLTGKLCNTSNYRDLNIDSSNKNKWISKHPQCVVYDDWERWSYYLCNRIGIKLEVQTKICDFTLELTRKIIPCDILIYIQAVKKSCDLGIKLDLDKDRCKAELNILVSEHKCDLSLKTYIELKKCNVTFDMVKKVYGCNLKLNVDSKLKPTLVTPLAEYELECITPSDLAPLLEIEQTPSISVEDILKNYE